MKHEDFIPLMQHRIAQVSVGAAALRNQGAPGIVQICRDYFESSIRLAEFKENLNSENYNNYLDKQTNQLLKKFPKEAKSWGAARKGLNLFFREVVYNFYLANHLEISRNRKNNNLILKQLEVPLDQYVAKGLIKLNSDLPKWKSIKSLDEKTHETYQISASKFSEEIRVPRVHLDLLFWRKNK